MNLLSSLNRPYLLEKLISSTHDLLIIGGGITGAGIALDAASRGIKTCLIEKQDFASGTSSRSTKLIHGGLRYLKQFEFNLVREVAHERTTTFNNAQHLVFPQKMLLPILKNGPYGKLSATLGLWIYDFLAGIKEHDWRYKILSKEDTVNEEPLLRRDILKGSGLYMEFGTDDARLTLEVIKTAARYGALPANYLRYNKFIYKNNCVCGVECVDLLTGKILIINANQVINSTGPWVDEVRRNDRLITGKRLHLTKGAHIVVRHIKLPLKYSVYFPVTGGRMVFAIPHGNVTYIGTTDTNYTGDMETLIASKEDATYLINAANEMFPSVTLKISDIISSWAGIRPLIHEEGKTPSDLRRRDEIFISESGLISIAGGKLTGYRKMAEKIVNIVNKNLMKVSGIAFIHCKTRGIKINGGEYTSQQEVNEHIKKISEKIISDGLENSSANYLVRTYGKQSDEILNKYFLISGSDSKIRLAKAQLWFAVTNESVYKLQDFFIRRTGMFLFEPESVKKLLPAIAEEMKNYLQWDTQRCGTEMEEMENLLKKMVTFE